MLSTFEAKTQQSSDGSQADRDESLTRLEESSDKLNESPTVESIDQLSANDRLLILETVMEMANDPESLEQQDLEKLRSFLRNDYNYKVYVNERNDSGETALHIAAKYGLFDVAKLLLAQFHANISAEDNEKRQPLHQACLEGHRDVAELLLENETNIEARQRQNATPLDQASWKGRVDVVELLLEKGADVLVEDIDGWSPLYSASVHGHSEVVKRLLAKDCSNINHLERHEKRTPLHAAIANEHSCVVIELIRHGIRSRQEILADRSMSGVEDKLVLSPHDKEDLQLDISDKAGHTPLIIACIDGFTEGVRLLINAGADCNVHTTSSGSTPLVIACDWGREDIVSQLLSNGKTNVDDKDKRNYTALHTACLSEHSSIIKILLEKVDLYVVDEDQQTPLHVATQRENKEIVELLLSKMSKVDQQDKNSQTALHLAVKCSNEDLTELLLKSRADPNIKDINKRTALHLVCEKMDSNIMKRLLEIKGDPKARDDQGRTPDYC